MARSPQEGSRAAFYHHLLVLETTKGPGRIFVPIIKLLEVSYKESEGCARRERSFPKGSGGVQGQGRGRGSPSLMLLCPGARGENSPAECLFHSRKPQEATATEQEHYEGMAALQAAYRKGGEEEHEECLLFF